MEKLLFEKETYSLIGACFEIYNDKGHGFLEVVYQECLELELQSRDVLFEAQTALYLEYKGKPLKQTYKPDLICFGKIIIELKAVKTIGDEHRAQVFNYLKATGYRVGYLVNFGSHPKLQYERIIC